MTGGNLLLLDALQRPRRRDAARARDACSSSPAAPWSSSATTAGSSTASAPTSQPARGDSQGASSPAATVVRRGQEEAAGEEGAKPHTASAYKPISRKAARMRQTIRIIAALEMLCIVAGAGPDRSARTSPSSLRWISKASAIGTRRSCSPKPSGASASRRDRITLARRGPGCRRLHRWRGVAGIRLRRQSPGAGLRRRVDHRFQLFGIYRQSHPARQASKTPAAAMIEYRREIMMCERAFRDIAPRERLSTVVTIDQGSGSCWPGRNDALRHRYLP